MGKEQGVSEMGMSEISYRIGNDLDLEEVIRVYRESGLAERRPADDRRRMGIMLREANLVVSAWDGGRMVGIARSLSDRAYVCYLSDLAVCRSHQRRGIGKGLIRVSVEQLEEGAMLLLLSAPAAEEYYPRIGFTHHPQAWYVRNGDWL